MIGIFKISTVKKDTVLFFSCCIFFVFCISCDKKKAQTFDENVVLKINNFDVSTAEYKLFLDEEKAMTYNYFYQKYGVEKNKTFWETSQNNETPIQYIKEKANKHLVDVKIIQEYASKINLVKPFNFEVFLDDWREENESRTLKHKAGEIVYGPINTNVRDYYFYLQTNLEIRLKDKLNETVFNPSEKELEGYFNEIKAIHFSYIDSISIEYLRFPYKTSTQRIESINKAKKILNTLSDDYSLKKFAENKNYQKTVFYDDEQLYGEENIERELKKFASILKNNEVKLFVPNDKMNSSIYIVKLLKPNKISFRNFKNVKKEVAYFYKETSYQQLMDSLCKEVVLKINNKVFDTISIK